MNEKNEKNEKNENKAPVNNFDKGQSTKRRGTKMVTVAQSAELLKRLSEFESKKESIMHRISEISDRMQKRLNNAADDAPDAKIPEFLTKSESTASSVVPNVFDVKFTRIRETNAPVLVDGGLYLFAPSRSACGADWEQKARELFGHPVVEGLLSFYENSLMIPSHSTVTIPSGVKLAFPRNNLSLMFRSMVPGLRIVAPAFVSADDTEEICVTFENPTLDMIHLELDKIMALGVMVESPRMSVEELLNSTFASWVEGRVKGAPTHAHLH